MWKILNDMGDRDVRLFVDYIRSSCLEDVFQVLKQNRLRIQKYTVGGAPYPDLRRNCCTITVTCGKNGLSDQVLMQLRALDGVQKVFIT